MIIASLLKRLFFFTRKGTSGRLADILLRFTVVPHVTSCSFFWKQRGVSMPRKEADHDLHLPSFLLLQTNARDILSANHVAELTRDGGADRE